MWRTVEECPVISKENYLVSQPLLFVTNGIVYAGDYHINGFFYNYNRRQNINIISRLPITGYIQAEKWCYLTDITVEMDKITIPLKEYQSLKADSEELSRLYAAGVDNWEGYSEAQEDEEEQDDN